jgi:hypothetical protein
MNYRCNQLEHQARIIKNSPELKYKSLILHYLDAIAQMPRSNSFHQSALIFIFSE